VDGSDSLLLETRSAEDRATLGRLEGNGRFLATFRAGQARLRAGPGARSAFGLALLASFGVVGKLLFVEEQLLARGKNKLISAINTLEYTIREFHVRLPCVRRAGSRILFLSPGGRLEHTCEFTTGPEPNDIVLAKLGTCN